MLPAPTKLFSLLVETVAEQHEATSPGCNGRQAADDEDEWEDTSDAGLLSELASLGPGERHSLAIPSTATARPGMAVSAMRLSTFLTARMQRKAPCPWCWLPKMRNMVFRTNTPNGHVVDWQNPLALDGQHRA